MGNHRFDIYDSSHANHSGSIIGSMGDHGQGLNMQQADLDIYKDIISDGDDDFDHFKKKKYGPGGFLSDDQHNNDTMFFLQNGSKRIQKDFIGMLGLQATSDLFKRSEKVQDKGDYLLIHRLNPNTKRMNQILQCKRCPLKFPKLCNLRDHLRIHKEDMPFKCKLCGKPFTQAGNRDRHERKRVCQKKLNN